MRPYRIPEIAKKYVEYDMIRNYTELPAFPDSRIRMLYACLSHASQNIEDNELHALVVGLVQLGMDTHELIDTVIDVKEQKQMRSRQLNVLAGDYFSGRFYQLLSRAGQIGMVRKLSGAVCEVNQVKVDLYVKMKQFRMPAEEYIQFGVLLKTKLFDVFTDKFDEQLSRLWPQLVKGISHCEFFDEELRRLDSPNQFIASWGYWYVMQEGTEGEKRLLSEPPAAEQTVQKLVAKYQLRNQLNEKLKLAVAHMQSLADKLESDKLAKELYRIGESFLQQFCLPCSGIQRDEVTTGGS